MGTLQPAQPNPDLADVRPYVIVLLLAGSGFLGVRHFMGHRHPVLIPLLLVPALVLGWLEWNFRQDEATFSRVASQVAGRSVSVQCQRFTGALVDASGELGYVKFDASGQPSDTGRLERDACNDLRAYLHSDKTDPPLDQVIAVQVLSHESQHLAGISSEAETECQALLKLPQVAEWLGATPGQASALAKRYASEVYPRMPSDYRSNDCDLTPLG